MTAAEVLLVAVALAGLGLAWWRWGWRGVAGAVAVIAGALGVAAGRRRPPPGPPPPPPPAPGQKASRTEGDIVREHAEERQAAIKSAADPANDDRLDDVADLANRRRR